MVLSQVFGKTKHRDNYDDFGELYDDFGENKTLSLRLSTNKKNLPKFLTSIKLPKAEIENNKSAQIQQKDISKFE